MAYSLSTVAGNYNDRWAYWQVIYHRNQRIDENLVVRVSSSLCPIRVIKQDTIVANSMPGASRIRQDICLRTLLDTILVWQTCNCLDIRTNKVLRSLPDNRLHVCWWVA